MNKMHISAALEILGALGTVLAAYIAWGTAPAIAILSAWALIYAYALAHRP